MRTTTTLLLIAFLIVGCVARPVGARPDADLAAAVLTEEVTLFKSPTCTCCAGHQAYLESAGASVRVQATENLDHIKNGMAIPAAMRSCHTSLVGGYFVEGHVPLEAIVRLLAERPDIDGIALPGMPAGSPGMGGSQQAPFVVYAVVDGTVAGVFGEF